MAARMPITDRMVDAAIEAAFACAKEWGEVPATATVADLRNPELSRIAMRRALEAAASHKQGDA
jgi:hypothetical protein